MEGNRGFCDLSAALIRLGGDVDLLKDMIRFFSEDAPPLVERIRGAIARGDTTELQLAAHSLKGLAANFDATATIAAAHRMEQIGQSGNAAAAPDALELLEREVDRLAAVLPGEAEKLSA